MTHAPPATVTILHCPACGRDDRVRYLRETMPHNTPQGTRCPALPVRVTYVAIASSTPLTNEGDQP
jgi:hypothetical protein